MSIVPSEFVEHSALVHYLSIKGYRYFHVPNSTYTKSWKQKATNKALGVSAGVPDLFVIARCGLIGIELKRLKGSATSKQQLAWVEALNRAGTPTKICKGYLEAIAFIDECDKRINTI